MLLFTYNVQMEMQRSIKMMTELVQWNVSISALGMPLGRAGVEGLGKDLG